MTQQGSTTATADAVESSLRELRGMLRNKIYMDETPVEVQMAMENALAALEGALRALGGAPRQPPRPLPAAADQPTQKQAQFLAYIHAYMCSNHAGLAPTHAVLQRYFNLTPPSVNSMLARLEQRGFIRRIPGQARGIMLTIDPAFLPPLERPFK
jgi:repressor LexA